METYPRPQLSDTLARSLREKGRRILITGASGWIGQTVLTMLRGALGPDGFEQRVLLFGSSARKITFGPGWEATQMSVSALATIDEAPSMLLHLAFLTMDRVQGMLAEEYVSQTRELTDTVIDSLGRAGVDRLFVASSGAASFTERDGPGSPIDLYGNAKRYEEQRAREWALADEGRRAIVTRIFSLAGPYINKHQTYAMASFINDSLTGKTIEVRAPREVWRSYVLVSELLTLILSMLLDDDAVERFNQFDSGGDSVELGELAATVDRLLGGRGVKRAEITDVAGDRYVGDSSTYNRLLEKYGIRPTSLGDQIKLTAQYIQGVADPSAPSVELRTEV